MFPPPASESQIDEAWFAVLCDLRERFDRSFTPEPNSGCWLWTEAATAKGYGLFRVGPRKRAAYGTHIALAAYRGISVPRGMCACHRCDNPPCVNPDHLWVGSRGDNTRDMFAKGRQRVGGPQTGWRKRARSSWARGEGAGGARLSPEQVLEIRSSPLSHWTLARLYGVGKTAIGNIKTRKTWAHIP